MNEKQAEQEDLRFTGIYSSDKEEVKIRILEALKTRPKSRIILVTSPASPLSRSHSGSGWSAYADKVYFAYAEMWKHENTIATNDDRLQEIEARYMTDKNEQSHIFENAKQQLKINQEIINNA